MASYNTTTTTATTTATQTGVQLVVSSQANTVTIGNYVTDVSLQPYMASTIISFLAYNMRPNQLIHVFFNSINVDQYCAPGLIPASITDSSDYTQIQVNGTWGAPIYTNAFGQVAGQFNVPDATFKTGTLILELADVTSLTLGGSAITTMCSAQFTDSNLSVTNQTITLTTVNPVISTLAVTNTVVSTTVTSNTIALAPPPPPVSPYIATSSHDGSAGTGSSGASGAGAGAGSGSSGGTSGGGDPLAQIFTVSTPTGEAGIFATSVDVFFNQTSLTANNGVSVYICDTDNGYPDSSSILPFSTTHLAMANVIVSNNSTAQTVFTFESPVFLNNGLQYALVIKPDNNDPDYQIWCANIGDVDVATGVQMYSQPGVGGTAFYGATASQWSPLQTQYVKFNLNRASFNSSYGDAYFNNANTDYISVYSVSYPNTSLGVLPGDIVYQSTNSTPSTVNTSISGTLNFYDTSKEIFYVGNSTGNFVGNTFVQVHRFPNTSTHTPNTSTIIAYANTSSLYNPIVDAFVGQFATIVPAGTSLYFEYFGTSNSYAVDASANPITLGYETPFYDKERIVASKSNEVALMASAKSVTVHSHMTTSSELLSPIIDTVKKKQLVIGNQVSPVHFDYNEYFTYGTEKSKYISEIVTLAPGQDSEDIQVIVTAFRPPPSDIKVYVKFLNGSDPDPISKKIWTPLINQSAALYSNPSNPSDLKEFTYTVPQYYGMISTNGAITSSNTSNTVTGYGTQFTTDLQVGWYVNMGANTTFSETTRQVVAIANNTSMTLNLPFNGNYSNVACFVVPPPTTAWSSANTITQVAGTVTTTTTNNAVIGSGTNFVSAFQPGSIITIAGDDQAIVSVTNSTYLTVGTPWSVAVTGANAYIQTTTGLTYLNSTYNLYNTFLQFQLKIILQSNSSADVPAMQSIQALALLM